MVVATRLSDPCGECFLGDQKRATRASGKRDAKYLVICPPPTLRDLSDRRNMGNRSMSTFAKAMRQQGFHKDDFVFVNSVRCQFKPDEVIAKDRNNIIKPCREFLLRIIDQMRPEVIISLGALPARQADNRAVKITKARGMPKWSEEHGAWVFHMLDPNYVNLYPQHLPTFNVDCKTLRNFIDSDFKLEEVNTSAGHYELVDDLQFLIDARPQTLAFDVETQGLRPKARDTKLLSMQFSADAGTGYMVTWDKTGAKASQRQKRKLRGQIRELMCHPDTHVIGQNLKFDAVWLLHELDIRIRIAQDTLMLTALMDENSNDKGIDHQIKIHVPEMAGYNDHFNATYDKSDMDSVPMHDFVPYGCGDVDAAIRLYEVQRPHLDGDPNLASHYRNISLPGLNAFVGIENRGMLIDRQALDDFAIVLAAQVAEQKQSLLDRIPRAVKRRHAAAGIKFSRSAFLKDILFSEAGFRLVPRVWTKTTEKLPDSQKQPSTSSKDHLPFFFDDTRPIAEFVSANQYEKLAELDNSGGTVGDFCINLAEYVKNERLLSTNVVGFREKYMVGDHIYPTYSLWTAVTGRSASKDPNGQNFPKRGKAAKSYRRIFIPPPGMVQLEADLSQAELRIAGDMSGDREMIRIYNETGGDIHTETACIVMGIDMDAFRRLPRDDQALARFKAKAVNFGFIYGMGWRKFIIYAKTQYGVEFTEFEARRIRNAFFDKYASLSPWHTAMRNFARRHKFVRSYSGRVRHLPMIDSAEEYIQHEAERQGINSPVQEFASSLGVMAMGRLDLEVDDRYLALTGFVHDALYAYCAPEHVEWGAKTLKHYMESNDLVGAFGRELRVPIVADVGFGWNAAAMWEMGTIEQDQSYDFDALAEKYRDEKTDELPDFGLPAQEVPPNNGQKDVPDYLRLAA